MNCPMSYDDEEERKNTHPDLLPEDGWSDPEEQERDRTLLKKAVGLLGLRTMTRKGATPSGHRRSVLREGRFAGRTARKSVRWADVVSGSGGSRNYRNRSLVPAGTGKIPTAVPNTQAASRKDIERRNQYLLALVKLRLARARAS